jgi:hypothetical protein
LGVGRGAYDSNQEKCTVTKTWRGLSSSKEEKGIAIYMARVRENCEKLMLVYEKFLE